MKKLTLLEANYVITKHIKYDDWLRTCQNFFENDTGSYHPPIVELESQTKYLKNSIKGGKVYEIPRSNIIVTKGRFNLSSIEDYIELDKRKVIISKKDYYKLSRLNLEEQYDIFCLDSKNDNLGQAHQSFYDHLISLLKNRMPVFDFLNCFYIKLEKFKTLEKAVFLHLGISLSDHLIKECKISVDKPAKVMMIEILKTEKELNRLKEDRKLVINRIICLEHTLDKLINKKEEIVTSSIINGVEVNSIKIDQEIELYSNEIDTVSQSRKEIIEKIKELTKKLKDLNCTIRPIFEKVIFQRILSGEFKKNKKKHIKLKSDTRKELNPKMIDHLLENLTKKSD